MYKLYTLYMQIKVLMCTTVIAYLIHPRIPIARRWPGVGAGDTGRNLAGAACRCRRPAMGSEDV